MVTTLAERVAAALEADEYAFHFLFSTRDNTHLYACCKRSDGFAVQHYVLEVDGTAVIDCTCPQCRKREAICKHKIIFALMDGLNVGRNNAPAAQFVTAAVAARFYTNNSHARPALGQLLEANA